jgi:single-strand DNA-binding protein
MSLNKVMLIGNLGSDPELRFTQSGQAVCNFSVATNERFTDKAGEKQERTEWHKIVVWGKQAENCEKYLSKGRQVFIEGRIQTRQWETDEGDTRYSTEVVAQNVKFLSGGNEGSSRSSGGDRGGGGGNRGQRRRTPPDNPTESFDQSFDDDDIPF